MNIPDVGANVYHDVRLAKQLLDLAVLEIDGYDSQTDAQQAICYGHVQALTDSARVALDSVRAKSKILDWMWKVGLTSNDETVLPGGVNEYYPRLKLQAIQFTGSNASAIEDWSEGRVWPSPVLEPTRDNPTGEYLQIRLAEDGDVIDTAIVGDWILKGFAGRYFKASDAYFNEAYKPAN